MSTQRTADWAAANQAHLTAALKELRVRLEGKLPPTRENIQPEADHLLESAALDQLCDLFELSQFERDILLLCTGAELDYSFAALVAGLPGASHLSGRPTFGLALTVFPETAHWSALAPGSPLRYWRLVEPAGRSDESLTAAPLRIDERILHFLAGVEEIEERLAGIITPSPMGNHGELPESLQDAADRIQRLWRRRSAGERWPAVCLCGPDAGIRRSIASAVSNHLGMSLHTLDARDIPVSGGEREALVRLWEREAALSGSALLVDVSDEIAEPERRRVLAAFVARVQGAVLVAAHDAPEFAATMAPAPVRFDLPMPRAAEQELLWRQALGDAAFALNGHIGALASQFHLDGHAMRGAADAAMTMTANDDGVELGTAVWEACRAQARPRLDDLAQRVVSPATWDDLVLAETEKQTLREIAVTARQRARVYEEWGFGAKVGARGLGLSVLFSGPSGTGKTMAAECLANDLCLDLYRIDLAGVVSKYIGETEKNLRRIFEAAEYGGAVLLFDEADALFGKRSEVKDSHDRYANIEVSYLLQCMETYRGLAILTTNIKDALDAAFLRRLRFVVSFTFPEAAERECIWRGVFPQATPIKDLDWKQLAQMNIAGGSIRNIALGAAFLAADEGVPVAMSHLNRAAVREYTKLEQAMTSSELADWPAPDGENRS